MKLKHFVSVCLYFTQSEIEGDNWLWNSNTTPNMCLFQNKVIMSGGHLRLPQEWLLNNVINNNIIGWGFCDIWNNQGRGKCYQPKPKAEADNTNQDLDYSGYHKNRI